MRLARTRSGGRASATRRASRCAAAVATAHWLRVTCSQWHRRRTRRSSSRTTPSDAARAGTFFPNSSRTDRSSASPTGATSNRWRADSAVATAHRIRSRAGRCDGCAKNVCVCAAKLEVKASSKQQAFFCILIFVFGELGTLHNRPSSPVTVQLCTLAARFVILQERSPKSATVHFFLKGPPGARVESARPRGGRWCWWWADKAVTGPREGKIVDRHTTSHNLPDQKAYTVYCTDPRV